MKNPFKKDDNNVALITITVLGAITAGILTYFYLTKEDEHNHDDEHKEHATDYLKVKAPHKRKQRTDLHDLENLITHK